MLNIMKNTGIVLIFAATFFCSFGQEEPSIMKKVRANYTPEKTVQSAFDLHINWKVREKEESKSGHIFLAPGDKFRVELGHVVWVCDGRTYWQYSKTSQQVIIKYFLDINLAHHPTRILAVHLNERKFKLKEKEGNFTVVDALIDPATEKSYATVIRLWINSKSGIIHKLMVVDKKGNISTYTFKKPRLGAEISEEMFRFEAPKDAKILDMRE